MRRTRDWTARGLALVALATAVSGGVALAGAHYVVTSTRQIKPSVLRALRTPGPRGERGPQGTAGPPGADGAVADYSASTGASGVSITDASLAAATATPLLSKALPAGNYALTATVSITASQLNSSPGVEVLCVLKGAGTTSVRTFLAGWDQNFTGGGGANGTLTWSLALPATSPATVTIGCADISGPGATTDVNSADVSASADINAVQVSSIR